MSVNNNQPPNDNNNKFVDHDPLSTPTTPEHFKDTQYMVNYIYQRDHKIDKILENQHGLRKDFKKHRNDLEEMGKDLKKIEESNKEMRKDNKKILKSFEKIGKSNKEKNEKLDKLKESLLNIINKKTKNPITKPVIKIIKKKEKNTEEKPLLEKNKKFKEKKEVKIILHEVSISNDRNFGQKIVEFIVKIFMFKLEAQVCQDPYFSQPSQNRSCVRNPDEDGRHLL